MSSRVITEESITRIRETVAPNITIQWDPVTNGGQVTFFMQDQITENGVYKGMQPHQGLRPKENSLDMKGVLIVPMEEIMNSTIVTSSGETPGYVLMVLIKAYFEQVFTDRLNNQDAADALKGGTIPVEEKASL
ncbi:hypothetical protein [Xanthomonas phage X1]|nr:hypothetical protein [Xanthomonas phage X1]